MLVLIIILAILCLLFLLTLFNIYVNASFDNELTLTIRAAFLKFQILPAKPKKKSKGEKKSSKKEKTDEKPKKDSSSAMSFLREKGISGILEIIRRIADLAKSTLKELFSHFIIEKLDIDLTIAGDDAADTAVKYGKYCAALYPALKIILETVRCDEYNVRIEPDFSDDPRSAARAVLKGKIRIIFLLKLIITKAYSAVRLYLTAKSHKK